MTAATPPITLPQPVLDRCERVLEYHQHSKFDERSTPVSARGPVKVWNDPVLYPGVPRTPLPTNILDLPVPTLDLLRQLKDCLPESMSNPPQNARTLASWLFMATGVIRSKKQGGIEVRTCPSAGYLHPCEIYVLAGGIDGIEPGLYHFSPGEFCLRKLRDGHTAVAVLKRGRPDLEFLKTVPAAIIVNGAYYRSARRFGQRAYRAMLVECGQLLENFAKIGEALGFTTLTRFRVPQGNVDDLISIPDDAPFALCEATAGMVVWGDAAARPIGPRPADLQLPSPLPRFDRAAPGDVISLGSLLATHEDCIAPGVAVREVHPPLTDLSPLPPTIPLMDRHPREEHAPGGLLSKALLKNTFCGAFVRRAIPRDDFIRLNRLTFRGGTYQPLQPDGAHVATVRPFWIIHDVIGFEPGVWYYDVIHDKWSVLARGEYRLESGYLALEDKSVVDAAAICVMAANLRYLLTQAGPDLYRMAHTEAGACAQRLYLAAASCGHGTRLLPAFYDDTVRKFLGLEHSGWEPLTLMALGAPPGTQAAASPDEDRLSLRD
jgi:SagB-type dehydrogenase family enzyme